MQCIEMKPEKNMTVISNDKGFTKVRKKNLLRHKDNG